VILDILVAMSSSRVSTAVNSQNSALSIVARHATKKRVTVGFLWLFGLFAVFFAPAPVKITDEKLALFKEHMSQASGVEKLLMNAERAYVEAEMKARRHKVWFWRFRPEYRAKVKEHQPEIDQALSQVSSLKRERDGIMKQAKRSLGLWSDAGLEESRSLLWSSFESGKVFSQRQTFWDSLFTILGSRDRDWISLLFNLLITAIVNYTVGGVMAVVTFIFSLPTFLASYSPNIFSAALFFLVAAVAAIALIASYLSLIYASGAAVVYTTAAFVNIQRQRIAFEQQQRLRHGANRYHRD
jgi:hypothetical protein